MIVLALALVVGIRFPSLEGLEPSVAAQLSEVRARLDTSAKTAPPAAVQMGAAGRAYHAYSMLEPAEDCYRRAASLDPAEWRWPYLLALVLEQANRPEAAAEQLQHALDRPEKYYPAILRLAALRLTLREPAAAERLLRVAQQHSPDDPALLAALGELDLAQGRTEDAAMHLARALEREPRANRLHYPLALAYRKLGRLAEAQAEAERVGSAGIRPRDPVLDEVLAQRRGARVHLLDAERAFAAGDYQGAYDAYERALSAGEATAPVLLQAAVSATRLGRYPEALACLERATRLAPEDDRIVFNRGVLLAHVGRYAEAAPLFLQVLSHTPEDTEATIELVVTLAALGRNDDAVARATQMRPDRTTCAAIAARLESARASSDIRKRLGAGPCGP
jgi:tetratricopeptide (TPR) repeat protein